MKKLYRRMIGALALSVMFVFPGISGFPQEVNEFTSETVQTAQAQKESVDASAKKQAAEEKVEFPILIGIP